jgi:hypothetical protein
MAGIELSNILINNLSYLSFIKEDMSLTLSIMIAFLIALLRALPVIAIKIEKRKKTHQSTKLLNNIYNGTLIACAVLFIAMASQAIIDYLDKKDEKAPLLDICINDERPLTRLSPNNDTIYFRILYCNVGNDIAKNISDTAIAITYPHGKNKIRHNWSKFNIE